MAWGSKQTATQLTSITTVQYFSTLVTLNPGETAHCQVTVNFPTSPTDNAIVEVFTTLDASTETWDDTAFMAFLVDRGIDPNDVSFTVSGVYRFRIGVRRSGSTDTLTSADLAYRLDGVSL